MEKGTPQAYVAPQSPEMHQTPPVYQTPPPQGAYQPPPQPMMFDQNGQPIQQYQQPQQQYFQQVPQGQIPMQQMPGQSPPIIQQQPGQVPQPQAQVQQPQAQKQGTTYQNATPIAALGRGAAPADCPACGQRAMTQISYEIGNTTHAWALGLCCLICLGCIPYVMNSLKDVQHKCGRCGVLLATWHRSGTTEVHIHS